MKKIKQFAKWLTVWTPAEKREVLIVFIVFLLIAVAGGWFYWYQWRPAEARKECEAVRSEYTKKNIAGSEVSINNAIKLMETKYENCLHEKGLK